MDGWMEKQPVECMCPCTVQTPADDALRARAELICTFWSGERLACPMSGRLSACNLLCPPPPRSSAPPAFLKTFPPTPQLAHKADNELFTAAIHLNTSWCNCLSVIPALIVHPPPSAPPDTLASERNTKNGLPLLSLQMNGCGRDFLLVGWNRTSRPPVGGPAFPRRSVQMPHCLQRVPWSPGRRGLGQKPALAFDLGDLP